MLRSMLILGLLGSGLAFAAVADEKHDHVPAAPTNAGFEKLKTLVGTWVKEGEDGKPTEEVVSVIRLTAGGSALHETIFPGQPMEMVSVYTAEGSDIVMTHYCIAGNQPQMRAKGTAPGKKLEFEFAGGTNLDPAKDMHMHSTVMTFIDDDHIELNGTGWENGKPAEEMCGIMKLVRKK